MGFLTTHLGNQVVCIQTRQMGHWLVVTFLMCMFPQSYATAPWLCELTLFIAMLLLSVFVHFVHAAFLYYIERTHSCSYLISFFAFSHMLTLIFSSGRTCARQLFWIYFCQERLSQDFNIITAKRKILTALIEMLHSLAFGRILILTVTQTFRRSENCSIWKKLDSSTWNHFEIATKRTFNKKERI